MIFKNHLPVLFVLFLTASLLPGNAAEPPAPSSTSVNTAAVPTAKEGKNGNWQQAHEELVKRVQTDRCDILFVGDSITQHWLKADRGKEIWARHYAPLKAINIGKAGDQTENVLWRLQHGGLGRVRPKVIVLQIGINNIKANTAPEIAEGIGAILTELKSALPESKILLLGVFPKKEPADRAKIKEINERIAAFDDGKIVSFLDIGEVFLNPDGTPKDGVFVDGLHPATKGYELWADAMKPRLEAMLNGAWPAPAAK